MIIRNNTLREPAAGEVGGGGVGGASAAPASTGQDVFGAKPDAGAGASGGEGAAAASAQQPAAKPAAQPPAAAPAQPTGLTAEALAEAMKKAGIGQQAAPASAPQAPKQYTQDDFDRVFHVAKIAPEEIADVLAGGEKAVASMQAIVQKAVKQATVMSSYLIQELKDKLDEEVSPLRNDYSTRQEKALYDEFFDKNPGYKGYEAALKQVVAELKGSGVKFKTKDEAFDTVKEKTLALMRSLPGFEKWEPGQAAADTGAGKQPVQSKPSMPALSRGGQGGAGGGAGAAGGQASKSAGQAVFA